jgi:hypothetical protein
VLKFIALALALAAFVVAQVKSPPQQWTDACDHAGCVIGP